MSNDKGNMVPFGDGEIPVWILLSRPEPDALYECLTDHCDGCADCHAYALCREAAAAVKAIRSAFGPARTAFVVGIDEGMPIAA